MTHFMEAVQAVCPDSLANAILDGYAASRTPDIVAAHDYYADPGAREIAHGIKRGDDDSIGMAAADMAKYVSSMDTLVPIPNHTGNAVTTLALCNAIADISGCHVLDILHGASRPRLYDLKRSGANPSDYDLSYSPDSYVNPGNIFLVDNVYATGRTAMNAFRAIPDAKILVYARDYSAHAVTEGVNDAISGSIANKVAEFAQSYIDRYALNIYRNLRIYKECRFEYRIGKPGYEPISIVLVDDPNRDDLAIYCPGDRSVRINEHSDIATCIAAEGTKRLRSTISDTIGGNVFSALTHEVGHQLDLIGFRFRSSPSKRLGKQIDTLNPDDKARRSARYAFSPTEINARVTKFMVRKVRQMCRDGKIVLDDADLEYLLYTYNGAKAPPRLRKSILRRSYMIIDAIMHCGASQGMPPDEIFSRVREYMSEFSGGNTSFASDVGEGVPPVNIFGRDGGSIPVGMLYDDPETVNLTSSAT